MGQTHGVPTSLPAACGRGSWRGAAGDGKQRAARPRSPRAPLIKGFPAAAGRPRNDISLSEHSDLEKQEGEARGAARSRCLPRPGRSWAVPGAAGWGRALLSGEGKNNLELGCLDAQPYSVVLGARGRQSRAGARRPYLGVHVGSLRVPLQRALDVGEAVGDEAGAVLPALRLLQRLLRGGSLPAEVPGHALGKTEGIQPSPDPWRRGALGSQPCFSLGLGTEGLLPSQLKTSWSSPSSATRGDGTSIRALLHIAWRQFPPDPSSRICPAINLS